MLRAVVTAGLVCLAADAQAGPHELRGTVRHGGQPIANASVLTERGAIAVTDRSGDFTVATGDADHEITVVAPGFVTRTVRIAGDWMQIDLEAASGAEVIEVTGQAPEQTKPLSYELTADEIRQIPGAGNDILRAVQALPGVARIPYAFGGLVLRGTSPRDTAVYLDGIEVPIAFHFGGITSFYPSGMLADLKLTAGGFDAGFGRAEGGLVTLTTREPRTDRWRLGGEIGLFDSNIQAEGPLPAGGGIIIGLRRSYFDRIAAPFVDDDIPLPSYYDFQIKTAWGDPRRSGRISPMLFGSIDRVASNEITLTSSFLRVAAPYLRSWGRTTLHVVPWLGWQTLSFEDHSDEERREFKRPTVPGGVRAELLHDTAWGHLRGGLELASGYLAGTQVNESGPNGGGDKTGSSTLAWADLGAWGEVRWQLDRDRFSLKPGVRVERYGLTGETVLDPRFNLTQRLTETLTLRQAVGRYHQPPTPGDVDPVDGNPRLQSSYFDQASLGLDATLPEAITASVTGYFAYGRGLGVQIRSPDPSSEEPEPNLGGLGPTFELLLEKQLGFAIYRANLGRGRSWGAEVAIKRNVGDWFTMISYTLSKSQRVDDAREGNGWRPFELDQRHNLNLAASVMLTHWRLGARVQIVSGNPYSPSELLPTGEIVQHAWAGTLPVFVSLDLRADRRWHRCWGDINFFIDIQNATNHGNVEGRDFDDGKQADADVPGLPIIPFVGVEFLPLK